MRVVCAVATGKRMEDVQPPTSKDAAALQSSARFRRCTPRERVDGADLRRNGTIGAEGTSETDARGAMEGGHGRGDGSTDGENGVTDQRVRVDMRRGVY
jgi:hypothetical protein